MKIKLKKIGKEMTKEHQKLISGGYGGTHNAHCTGGGPACNIAVDLCQYADQVCIQTGCGRSQYCI
jgi:hypothetical protein